MTRRNYEFDAADDFNEYDNKNVTYDGLEWTPRKTRRGPSREVNQYVGYITPDEAGSTHRQRPR
jgi:hypothetical protein